MGCPVSESRTVTFIVAPFVTTGRWGTSSAASPRLASVKEIPNANARQGAKPSQYNELGERMASNSTGYVERCSFLHRGFIAINASQMHLPLWQRLRGHRTFFAMWCT